MTTITYRAGVMACDSCWTNGNECVDTLTTKIRRLAGGALLGQSGGNDGRVFEKLLDKVKTPTQLPAFEQLAAIRQDFLGLLVLPKGQVFKIATVLRSPETWGEDFAEDLGVWPIQAPFAAAGSGAELAIGAMAAGASAREAVAIACRYDINSRLPLHSLTLNPGKRGKK